MDSRNAIAKICVVAGAASVMGCATSYDEDHKVHMDFKSRSVVERMADDEISVNGVDSMAAMKKERKLPIAPGAVDDEFVREAVHFRRARG